MGTFIIALLVFGAAGAAAWSLWRRRQNGDCGCGCEGCGLKCHK